MRKFLRKRVAKPEIVIRTADGEPLARVPPEVRQEMHYLWTRLELHGGDLPRSVGVTSQLSGEGVSFISRALAAVLARQGRACLVEANWWGQGFDLPTDGNEGLAGLLQGSSGIDDVLVPTNHPGLWIVPSGDLNVSSSAVVSSLEVMSSVLEGLHARFRHTILDLPAISTSATALSFAAAADSSLLVVRQRVTRVDQVDSAANDLRHTRLLGVVINDNRVSMPKFLQRRLLPQR
jgi:Mrp family chromosome partitioning ATPase